MSYCKTCRKGGGCEHTDKQFPYSMPAEMARLERQLAELKANSLPLSRVRELLTEQREACWRSVDRWFANVPPPNQHPGDAVRATPLVAIDAEVSRE